MPKSQSESSKDAEDIRKILDGLVKDIDSDRADQLCREHPELADKIRSALSESDLRKAELDKTSAVPRSAGDSSSAWAVLIEQLRTRGAAHSRYKFEGEIARGGMGEIHRVFDADVRRHLALKRIRMRDGMTAETADELLGRFLEEAQVTGQLDHPGIVPVHEVGVDPDQNVYYTMKLVRGTDLRTVFDQARGGKDGWTITRVVGVLLKVCEAMSYAHAKGVIHRDLKPANVMVGNYGEVFVMDWGIARVMNREPETKTISKRDDRSSTIRTMRSQAAAGAASNPVAGVGKDSAMTMFGEVLGTAEFMPPEQARGQLDKIGPPADVYAVGAMLYTLLAGHAPYLDAGPPADIVERLTRVVNGPPKPLADCDCDAPAELIAICEKAMERKLSDRYPSMDEFAADLRAYLEGRVVSAYSGGLFTYLRKWIARHRGLAATAAIALCVTAGISAWYWQDLKKKEAEKQVEFERMADVGKLAELLDRQAKLWPVTDESVEALDQWLADANALEARLPLHRQTLAELKERGANRSSAAPTPDRIKQESELERSLHFLVSGLESLAKDDPFSATIASVMRRRQQAGEQRNVMNREGRAAWADAIAAIADPAVSPAYNGLRITPQAGLLPIGQDPQSKLWEFWHMPSGARPERDPKTGKYAMDENSGVILVLVPGGHALLGTSSEELWREMFPRNEINPAREVDLRPFFASKFEFTQGQWKRVTGTNPSTYDWLTAQAALRIEPSSPVESVTRVACIQTLGMIGLRLPTRDEWEFSARGGKPIGPLASDEANIAGGNFIAAAPVGQLKPNGYGLYDTLGNVWEWCDDGRLLPGNSRPYDISCGGGCADGANDAIAISQEPEPPQTADGDLGVRPFRSLDP